MAGAGGTGPQKPAFDLHDFLAGEIAKTLMAQQPQMPQPPQPQPLSPASAYAAARNPQTLPYFSNMANAPEQARYASQQAAFEAAMSGRQGALQAGVGLVRAQDDPLNAARLQELMRHNQAMENKPPNMAFLPTPEGYIPASRRTGTATGGPVQIPGGGTAYPNPPAGVVQSVAAETATLGGLDSLEQAYQKIHATVGDRILPRQVAGTLVGESRLGGALAPEYAEYTSARRAALNAYIKSVTGAQFSVKELERYEGQYPEPWDPPELARQKIQVLRDRAQSDMRAKIRAYPATGAAAPQQPAESIVDKAMRLAEEARKGGSRANP